MDNYCGRVKNQFLPLCVFTKKANDKNRKYTPKTGNGILFATGQPENLGKKE